jgi:hypothetical protein
LRSQLIATVRAFSVEGYNQPKPLLPEIKRAPKRSI